MRRHTIRAVGATAVAGLALLLAPQAGAQTAQEPADFVAYLSGDQEVPAVDTDAWGWMELSVDDDGSIDYSARIFGLEGAVAGHLHLAVRGVNGPVVVPLQVPGAPGSDGCIVNDGSRRVVMADDDENDGVCENLTAAACQDVLYGRTADDRLTGTNDGGTGDEAPRNAVPKPAACGFADVSGTVDGTALAGPLAEADLDALVGAMEDGEIYANFHTAENPSGEIRGQLVANAADSS